MGSPRTVPVGPECKTGGVALLHPEAMRDSRSEFKDKAGRAELFDSACAETHPAEMAGARELQAVHGGAACWTLPNSERVAPGAMD
jgi:hypothetical protein